MAENGPIEIGVKVDTAQAARNIDDFSKKSRTALTSLSLVLQDLPFGFIGIQNNLPGLIQGFNELRAQTGSAKSAFSQLASSISGPAGLLLGYSAAISLTTVLVQKYGSLGGALDAFIGKTRSAADIQNKFNKELESSIKSTSGEIANLESLVKILTDVNSTRSQQIGAYDEINKSYQGLLSNINSENTANEKSIGLIEDRLELYKQQILLEGRRESLIKLIGEASVEGERAINALTNRSNLGFFDKLGLELRGLFAGIGGLGVINVLNQDLGNAAKSANSYSNSLNSVNKELTGVNGQIADLIKSGKKQKDFTLNIDTQELDAAFNLEKIISSITKYGNIILDTNKSVQERKNALNELIAINPKVFSGLSLEKSATLSNKDAIESYIRSLQILIKEKEFSARASQVNAEFIKIEQKQLEQTKKAQEQAAKAEQDRLDGIIKLTYGQDEYGNSTDKIVKKNNKYLEQLGEIQTINEGVIDILNKGLGVENIFEKAIKDILNFEEYQKAAIDRITKNFRFLQNPLEGLFGTILEEGIANWKSFGDAVIVEIKRIAAALLAKGVIQLLGNLLAPGLGSVLGKGFQGISDQTLFDFGFGTGAANFSGVQAGGLQMAGAVNLQLRGSDLVASINRTNTTINRVG
jgi:hypothetical protein